MAQELETGGSVSVSSNNNNTIVVTSSDENSTRIIAQVDDITNIDKYGLLQETISIDDKDISQARNIAENKLNDFNRIIEDNFIELLGNDQVRAGRIIELNEPITGLVGRYLVKECTHTFVNNVHKMQLQIEVA